MADQLTEDQVADLKKAFEMFDKDGNGTISEDELSEVLSSLGTETSEEDMQEFVQQLGGNDGKVRWEEFLNWMAKMMTTSQ